MSVKTLSSSANKPKNDFVPKEVKRVVWIERCFDVKKVDYWLPSDDSSSDDEDFVIDDW